MTEQDLRRELDAAIDLNDEDNWNAALEAFDKLVSAYPNEMQPRFERAMVLLNLDRIQAAIGDLEHVLKHSPDYPGAATWYAIALRDQNKPMEAAKVQLRHLQSTPPEHWSVNGRAWSDCAANFLKAGTPERALAALDIYFDRYEGKQSGFDMFLGAPYRFRAEALLLLGRLQEALDAVQRACADLHSVPADRFLRIRILAALGERDGAVADLQQLWREQQWPNSSGWDDSGIEGAFTCQRTGRRRPAKRKR